MSRNNPPVRANYESDSAYEYAMRQYNERYPTPERGALNWNQTKVWDGSKWNDVNIINRGQRATLQNETVYADGKGNWRSLADVDVQGPHRHPGRVIGSYNPQQGREELSVYQKGTDFNKLYGDVVSKSAKPRISEFDGNSNGGGGGGGGGGPTRDNMAKSSELDRYRVFVEANKGIAENVKPGQAGYNEIQAILAEKEGGPAAVDTVAFMDDYGRSPGDAIAALSGTKEKPVSMEWTTDMGINARSASAPIPAEGIPQTGTQMSSGGALVGGSTTEGISRNLLGTELSGISQADYKGSFTAGAFPGIDGVKDFDGQTRLLPAEIQTPDQSGTIPVDTLYASGNNIADALDSQRTIAFPTPEELKGNYISRIMGRS